MIRKSIAAVLGALSLTAAAPAATTADLDPALWVVKDADTTIYLFGTIHALGPDQNWFNDEVKAAFDSAGQLMVEVDMPEDKNKLGEEVRKYGMLPAGQSLPDKLSPEGRKLLGDDLASLGLPRTTLDTFKPFFAGVTLNLLHLMKAGINADQGAEKVLEAAAEVAKKPVGSLETLQFQLSLFDALPEAEQVRMLEDGLKNKEFGTESLAPLIKAWGAGDADTVATIMKDTDTDSPLLYKKLLVDRNVTWAEWIGKRLQQPGTVFMAVGAGHLAGSDSVQQMLARRGIATSRVPRAN